MFNRLRSIIFLALTAFSAALLLTSMSASAFPGAAGLDVDTVVSDPFAYSGEITVRGGVMGVDAENGRFWIIDYREYKSCGIVTCAPKSMTVKWSKTLPKGKDVVEVTGVIERSGSAKGGFVLNATAVKVK